MDEARRVQIEIWKRWTADERLAAAGRLTDLVLELRDIRLRDRYPQASEDEIVRLRLAEVMAQNGLPVPAEWAPARCVPEGRDHNTRGQP